LKPFPFQTVSDTFDYVANANYNAVQLLLNMRAWHGLLFSANYTYSRAIDDGGTFRSGYAIPAGTIANEPAVSYPADRIERSVSTSNQPQHFVLTSVWDLPFGRSMLNENHLVRAVVGGFKFSGTYQAFSGSPLAITGSTCQTNPADSTCEPTLNPNFTGSARQNGKWGDGVNRATYNAPPVAGVPVSSSTFIVPSIGGAIVGAAGTTPTPTSVSGPFISPIANIPSVTAGSAAGDQVTLLNTAAAPAYTFGNSPRTAPFNLYGPGNFQLDLALVRSFPLHLTEGSRLDFRAEMYNVTNHTFFGVASTVVGNAAFGQVTSNPLYNRRAVQLSARLAF